MGSFFTNEEGLGVMLKATQMTGKIGTHIHTFQCGDLELFPHLGVNNGNSKRSGLIGQEVAIIRGLEMNFQI